MAGRQGGKVLRGPQSGGLMIGKRAPLKAAQANASPNGGIGRPMKVGKEEQMGMLAAVNSSPLPESSAAGQPFRATAEGRRRWCRWSSGCHATTSRSGQRGRPTYRRSPTARLRSLPSR